MKIAITAAPALLLLSSLANASEPLSVRLEVSATIPPRPCEYPRDCARAVDDSITHATIEAEDAGISYLGSEPQVERSADRITVLF